MSVGKSETINGIIPSHRRRTVSDVVSDLEQRIAKLENRTRLLPLGEETRGNDIMYGALIAYEEALRLIRTCRYRRYS